MANTEVISLIKKLKPKWKKSFINILKTENPYYALGGYNITIADIEYKSKKYQLRHDLTDSFILEIN